MKLRVLALAGVVGIGLAAGSASAVDPSPRPEVGKAAGPNLKVSATNNLDPKGQNLTIDGSGYSSTKNGAVGIYVVMGPKRKDGTSNADVYQDAAWVSVAGIGGPPMRADGSFKGVTFEGLKAKYADSEGKVIDCYKEQCYIMSIAAHGSADRSQDFSVPIHFKGNSATAPVGTSVGPNVGQSSAPSPTGSTSSAPSTTPTASNAPSAASPSALASSSASPSESAAALPSDSPAESPAAGAVLAEPLRIEKKSSNAGIAIGAGAVVALVFGAVGFVALRRRGASA